MLKGGIVTEEKQRSFLTALKIVRGLPDCADAFTQAGTLLQLFPEFDDQQLCRLRLYLQTINENGYEYLPFLFVANALHILLYEKEIDMNQLSVCLKDPEGTAVEEQNPVTSGLMFRLDDVA